MKETAAANYKYLIIGAGGTGCAIGACLARAGKDVAWIARGAQLAAMQEKGLVIERPQDSFVIRRTAAFSMEDYDGRPDVIFVCVKGYSIDETIPFIRRVAGPDSLVIPILNIYGTGARMQKDLAHVTVTDGCVYVAAHVKEPGCIQMSGSILRLVYGLRREDRERAAGTDLFARLCKVRDDLKESGIDPLLSDWIERDAMMKYTYIAAQNGCGVYYDIPAGPMQKPGIYRDLFAGLTAEIVLLAKNMGIEFTEDPVEKNLRIIDTLAPDMLTSMQRDLKAGKPTEIRGLVYAVPGMADQYGADLPLFAKVTKELKDRGIGC